MHDLVAHSIIGHVLLRIEGYRFAHVQVIGDALIQTPTIDALSDDTIYVISIALSQLLARSYHVT
jgi:hypothetical protein